MNSLVENKWSDASKRADADIVRGVLNLRATSMEDAGLITLQNPPTLDSQFVSL